MLPDSDMAFYSACLGEYMAAALFQIFLTYVSGFMIAEDGAIILADAHVLSSHAHVLPLDSDLDVSRTWYSLR